MASTPLSSLKATTSTTSPTTSSAKSSEHSSSTPSVAIQQETRRPQGIDEDNDSGDEWGVEIGDLIIDLDADVANDEMKEKNDARNSNNNNSIKGSNNTQNSQPSMLSNDSILNSAAKLDSGNLTKSGKLGSTPVGNNTPQGKTKSKSKKSNKSSTMNKHISALTQNMTSASTPVVGRNDLPLGSDTSSPSVSGGRAAKPEASSSKANRSYKKHGKNNSNEKKSDTGNMANKDAREKTTKSGKSSKHQNPNSAATAAASTAYSIAPAAFTAPSVAGSFSTAANKGKRDNSPSFSSAVSNITNHCSKAPIDGLTGIPTAVTNANDQVASFDKTITTHANEAPVMGAVAHLGKHRKTSSLPAPMKYQKPSGTHNVMSASQVMSNVPSPLTGQGLSNLEPLGVQNTVGKRERNSSNTTMLSAGSKKIRLEKEGKIYSSGMTPNDGECIAKASAGSLANISLPGHLANLKSEFKMTIGQKSSLNDSKVDKKTNSARTALSSAPSNMQHVTKGGAMTVSNSSGTATPPGDQASANFPQNNVPTPGDQSDSNKRTVGTVTTYADVGVSTEPESLGPCEPGTSVRLSGIVWHETESGVLVVNVTWRNRSYVGTLLDATKHDWAPPRIPDIDSDAEYRVKSGRPKRQRGSNGADGGRKGRKSAMVNSLDEYKCSPSSNKRRSAKMSESDAYSGNDGEICTTPSKSAKRARMSRTAAAKQAAQKTVNTTIVKESSGDGTSGSGSSACSSPVFMECPYANCKKRYKDDNAFKYHESHAHQGEELEDVEKSGQEEESPPADSPKDSENSSTKSEEMQASDSSSGSPNAGDNEQTPKEPENAYQTAMETDTQAPSTQAPFVVTQQPQIAPTEQQYAASAYPVSNKTPMQSSFVKNVQNNEARSRNNYPVKPSTGFETSRPATEPAVPTDGAVSPYTLTDSQSNDSISLKTHMQTKPQHRSYPVSRPTPSIPVTSEPNEHAAALEASTAVDNESAQAVQTLLQLQENSQDQLPGLTSYGQTSQAATMALSNLMSAASNPSSSIATSQLHSSNPPPSAPADKFVPSPHAKPQTGPHTMTPPFRGHSKDGTPLPRMSVGVCSPRSQTGGQYVMGGYSHGTVTANSSQDRSPHHPSTGLKTVKGKTVPIPTDPQQTLTVTSQPGGGIQIPGSAGNAKKQKRKKPKPETVKSPSEPVTKPNPTQPTIRTPMKDDVPKPGHPISEQATIKQEHPHHVQPGPVHPTAHHRIQYDPQLHGSKQPPGTVKTEPGTKPASAPQPPRSQAFGHPSAPHTQRPVYPHPEQSGREQIAPQVTPGNRNNNNKLTPHGVPGPMHPQQRRSSPVLSDAQEKGETQSIRDGRPRIARAHVPHGASHSLPGSRSMTPVDPSTQTRYRLNVPPTTRDSTTPTNSQGVPTMRRSSSKESSSPPPPFGSRRLSSEGAGDLKRSPASGQRPYPAHGVPQMYGPSGMINQFVMPYDIGTYQAQFMHEPKFQQHYEQVIQQEMQKDKRIKEESGEGPSFRSRFTPSPNPQLKAVRPKSPTARSEERLRGPSPRPQPYPQQPNQHVPPVSRATLGPQHVHAPRGSPLPHGSFPSTPNKLSAGAPQVSARVLSPRPQATPPPLTGNRPPRPSSETERYHRREPSTGERPPTTSRTPVTPNRKPPAKEGYPEHHPQSPDKLKSGQPPPTSVYASPGVPVQIPPGSRTPVQYYTAPYQHPLIDPRVNYAFPAYAMFPTAHPIFHGHWPTGAPPPGMPTGQERTPSQSPHSMKPSLERPPGGTRSPYRDDPDRRPRADIRGRDSDSFSSSKERRISDGPSRKSVTPDPKAAPNRNHPGEGNSGTASPPPMQRHLHTHHHIHEGIPIIPPHQYPYQMASAVMAGSAEAAAAAALSQYPKRDLP